MSEIRVCVVEGDTESSVMTFSSASTVDDVLKKCGKKKSHVLVLADGRPPRVVSETLLLAGLVGSVALEHRKVLRFELRSRDETQPSHLRSYREVAVATSAVSTKSTPGLLRVPDRAKQEKTQQLEEEKAVERREQRQALGSKPRPSEGVMLSDLISMQQMKDGKKTVKISLSSTVQKQRETPTASTKVRSNPNPADGRTDVKERGKERLVPKKKKPTKLKQIIQAERQQKEKKEGKEEEEGGGDRGKKEEQQEDKMGEDAPKVEEVEEVEDAKEAEEEKELDNDDGDADDDDDDDEVVKKEEEEGEKVNFLLIKKPFSNLDLKLRSETELEMNRRIVFFLSELRRFQQRLFEKNPEKARLKKRILLGLREVDRAARRGKLRCVFLAPNVEDIQSKGGLNDLQTSILGHCKNNNIPVLICMTRGTLGAAVGKRMSVSAVGVVEYDGANAIWKEIAAKYEIVAKEREARLEPPAVVEEKKEEKEEKKEVATKKPIKWNIPQSQFVPSRTNLE